NDKADNLLYGHLNPKWVLFELHQLAQKVDPQHPTLALKGFPIVITHIKQGLEKTSNSIIIRQQLEKGNDLGVKFIVPVQYQALQF
ncbi:MAG: 3',5'-cyclic-nucleotide phosphodiesterase, partial [Legionella longbeachae]|nr:3',5'-cyclic-nucleotide phosphodiesterase [Legionella longbeachae]